MPADTPAPDSKPSDTTGWASLATAAVAAGLALVVLSAFASGQQLNLEDFALTDGTTSVFAEKEGYAIHAQSLDDLPDLIAGNRQRGGHPVALWLGNSQLHAINQHRPGDETAVPIAHRRLVGDEIDVVGFSEPNANLQEHYVRFERLRRELPIETLILSLVFDDTRETGLRPDVATALQDADTEAAVASTEIGKRLLVASRTGTLAGGDFAGLQETVQDSVERGLNGWLEAQWSLWNARPKLRGRLFTSAYLVRNWALGIKPTSKRRVIRSRYRDNLQALEAILASARSANISTLAYVAPLRNDVAPPYESNEYEQFRRDVEVLATKYGATLLDLEGLVPAELWGQKESTDFSEGLEIDFMHFQAGGHELLADAIADAIAASPDSGDP